MEVKLMKNNKFYLSLLVTSALLPVVAPLISEKVEANAIPVKGSHGLPLISEDAGLDDDREKQVWSDEKVDQFTETLSELHPEFTKAYLKRLIESQLNDEGIPTLSKSDIVTSHLTGRFLLKKTGKGLL